MRNWPYRKKGETFGAYWNRCTPHEVGAFCFFARNLGIQPQSFFKTMIQVEPSADDQLREELQVFSGYVV